MDDLVFILTAYPNVTHLHVNIVDIFITMVYTNDIDVLSGIFCRGVVISSLHQNPFIRND